MSARKSAILTTIFFTAAATQLAPEFAARAQSANQRDVYLVRLDQSACTNSNVPNKDTPDVDGLVTVTRGDDGNTTVKIAMTASSNTTYHFYLKCVRQFGDITTGDEGVGEASFTFPTNSAATTYAFDISGGSTSRKQVPQRDGELLASRASPAGTEDVAARSLTERAAGSPSVA
jgi:hypothetical protein